MTSNMFFCSDTHFGHRKIREYAPTTRPQVATVEEMDEIMIVQWNQIVPPGAIIYHLGDFAFYHRKEQIHEILARLNGRIHLILGNHDEDIIKNRAEFTGHENQQDWIGRFASIRDYREINVEGQKICLCHFPILSWNGMHKNTIMFHGHTHASIEHLNKYTRRTDVGWDVWLGPVESSEVIKFTNSKPIEIIDHHCSIDKN